MRRSLTSRAVLVLALLSSASSIRAAEPQSPGDWTVSAGPGLYVFPAYPGSSRLKLFPLPAQDIAWRDRIFSQGPDVLGINVLRGENYHVGTSLSFDFQSRSASDDARLKGLPDVHYGPKLRLFADYTWWAFTGAAAVYQDIAGTGQGTTAMADFFVSAPLGKLLLSMGPGITWGSAEYTRTFFGVSAQESAASGLPQYATRSGLRDVHVNASATYEIDSHWSANVSAVFGRLERSAAGSPITQRRLDVNGMASAAYRF
ncbi:MULTISPECIES: MipA/OmpV family protein [unclassified Caballeronia]|uniref:MipA/OmpV family protein n=1 Tax=unclassified Caballeronia TaxID=2646786 RepID=UPI00285CFB55|nr:MULTISPECIES: MipA/OmpV family protein [unclassified Caballeronia]MDR5741066.1 MipA/OmpV family protein [Caballeronia sp. LZ016]MDR5806966.1 MipA/OmpV family protein [Caballeronia sp. LZ019]